MHKKIYSNVIFKIIFKDDDDGDEGKKKKLGRKREREEISFNSYEKIKFSS